MLPFVLPGHAVKAEPTGSVESEGPRQRQDQRRGHDHGSELQESPSADMQPVAAQRRKPHYGRERSGHRQVRPRSTPIRTAARTCSSTFPVSTMRPAGSPAGRLLTDCSQPPAPRPTPRLRARPNGLQAAGAAWSAHRWRRSSPALRPGRTGRRPAAKPPADVLHGTDGTMFGPSQHHRGRDGAGDKSRQTKLEHFDIGLDRLAEIARLPQPQQSTARREACADSI